MRNYLLQIGSILTKRQRLGSFLLVMLLFIGMLLEILGLGILVPLLSLIIEPKKINQTPIIKEIKFFFHEISNKQFIIYFLLFFLFLYLVKTVFLVYLNYKQNKFITGVTSNISNKLFQNYLDQPYSFFLKKNTSEIIKTLQVEVTNFSAFFSSFISAFVEIAMIFSISMTLIYIEKICINVTHNKISCNTFYRIYSIYSNAREIRNKNCFNHFQTQHFSHQIVIYF